MEASPSKETHLRNPRTTPNSTNVDSDILPVPQTLDSGGGALCFSRSTSPEFAQRQNAETAPTVNSSSSDNVETIEINAAADIAPKQAVKVRLPKRFFCTVCSQGFTRKHNMVSHELIHTSLRPHICTVCSKRFRRIHDLKRHEKLHTGDKPFFCDKCNRSFARPDALSRHQKSQNACLATDEGEDSSLGLVPELRQLTGPLLLPPTPAEVFSAGNVNVNLDIKDIRVKPELTTTPTPSVVSHSGNDSASDAISRENYGINRWKAYYRQQQQQNERLQAQNKEHTNPQGRSQEDPHEGSQERARERDDHNMEGERNAQKYNPGGHRFSELQRYNHHEDRPNVLREHGRSNLRFPYSTTTTTTTTTITTTNRKGEGRDQTLPSHPEHECRSSFHGQPYSQQQQQQQPAPGYPQFYPLPGTDQAQFYERQSQLQQNQQYGYHPLMPPPGSLYCSPQSPYGDTAHTEFLQQRILHQQRQIQKMQDERDCDRLERDRERLERERQERDRLEREQTERDRHALELQKNQNFVSMTHYQDLVSYTNALQESLSKMNTRLRSLEEDVHPNENRRGDTTGATQREPAGPPP